MLQERHFAAMKVDATFINSGRGQVVDEPGFISVLSRRPDLTAILDVTHPEPPAPDSPFYTLPNVVLTPHIAGSMGRECRRMGRMMSEELALYLADKPMLYEINSTQAALRA
jgi:phosphoglycerate dehydrogenase-like enzyme